MPTTDYFNENLEKWTFLNYQYKDAIKHLESNTVNICRNEKGEPVNLTKKNEKETFYYYSEDLTKETKQWFLSLNLKSESVLYVYGIGLGFYYEALKSWIQQDKKRHVIFLEDDLEIVKCFLGTSLAKDLMNDQQVSLIYFTEESCYYRMQFSTSLFSLNEFKFSALNQYKAQRLQKCSELNSTISHAHQAHRIKGTEYLVLNKGYVHNFYKNIFNLKNAKLHLSLIGEFKKIPVVICGAGPSLEKNIHLLKELQDKAIIMAGGTAMNVLNAHGIVPHFGLGIDPNPSHYNRLISNNAFETPFFYRQRIYPAALDVVHGETIYVKGAGGYKITDWFEKTLGIASSKEIEEGYNVVNFNLTIAETLGCNPILLAGVDLAYSNNKSYPDGLINHASQDPKTAFLTKSTSEELLMKEDIYGEPVQTLWKWINESLWYTYYASENPHVSIINCTEGGIGFSRVTNSTLKAAAHLFLVKDYDFAAMIHGALQNEMFNEKITQNKIIESLKIFNNSLQKCENFCKIIIEEKKEDLQKLAQKLNINTKSNPKNLNDFNEEIATKYLLDEYINAYIALFFPHYQFIEAHPQFKTPEKINELRVQFDIGLYLFILDVIRMNIHLIFKCLNDFSKKNEMISLKPAEEVIRLQRQLEEDFQNAQKIDNYSFENSCLTIEDKELDIHIEDNSKVVNEKIFYDDGKLKMNCFRLDKKLHGQLTYFSKTGSILVKHWYYLGSKEGKWIDYYNDEKIYAITRYKNNLKTGRSEYYYSNGLPKTVLNYLKDDLDGDVILFYSNGRIKRNLKFQQGKKEGQEQYWNEDGHLIFEALYKDNKPVGIAKEWHSNGKLKREIDHSKTPIEIQSWDTNGVLLKNKSDDYFYKLSDNSKLLNGALNQFYRSLVDLAPIIDERSSKSDENLQGSSIEDDLMRLKEEMNNMDQLKQKLIEAETGSDSNEQIWKTFEVEKLMQETLGSLTNELNDTLIETQSNMQKMIDELNKNMNLPPQNPNE